MQLKRFAQICDSLLFRLALAGDIQVQALRNEPIPLSPDRDRKRTFHMNDSAIPPPGCE